eukprot:CAMPEP_0180384426 /NCGR_PEP_ID=MMETSP0989-20121125/28523_1 /TAXON_ID=697907 /ORGANISM="non described non described, Strain CCMP2293" /LENGTH=54 /DNA_ID=CAMNT_0022384869 /DNA_START=104 /DNA_END=268 /DNA_ORIENTATION=+
MLVLCIASINIPLAPVSAWPLSRGSRSIEIGRAAELPAAGGKISTSESDPTSSM